MFVLPRTSALWQSANHSLRVIVVDSVVVHCSLVLVVSVYVRSFYYAT